MFGENPLLGTSGEYSVDAKKRVILPASTGRENNDVVVLRYDDVVECYQIYVRKELIKKLKRLDKWSSAVSTEEEMLRRKKVYYEFCQSILKECNVDCQGRINLPQEFVPGEKIVFVGANDHLLIKRKEKK